MKDYKVGEYYNFWVTGIGNHRIYLKDENGDTFSVYAYDFQTEWDWASPQVPVNILKCYVKEVSDSGNLVLQQSRDILLIVLYPEAHRGEEKRDVFIVDSLKTIGHTIYYVVVDVYGIQHMYRPSAGHEGLQPGDEVELIVKGICEKENNRSYLIFEEVVAAEQLRDVTIQYDNTQSLAESDGAVTTVGKFGEETDKVEFKSTIVYPAGATAADIDTQMHVILRTVAGFLNAKGGKLYIGVNDNGDAVGIEQEFCMLNSSAKDKNTYQENKDGYENKLRSGINFHLGPVAEDYVAVTFLEEDGHVVCLLEVKPSQSVIWYDQRDAYKRIGNRTSHLRSEAIVKLVLDKASLPRPAVLQIEPTPVNSEEEILPSDVLSDSEEEVPVVRKVEKPATIKFIGEETQGHGSFYMNMFSNGEWSWSKTMPTDPDVEFCIPINSPASKNNLIMVYEDGCVNRVDAYHLHLAKQEGKRYMNGRRGDGVRLVKVFHAKAEDLLACFSVQHGHDFVKVHSVAHVAQHENMGLKGIRVINTTGLDGITKAEICFVAAEHDQRISALKKTEHQLSNSLGLQMDLPKNAKFMRVKETLETLCDVPE